LSQTVPLTSRQVAASDKYSKLHLKPGQILFPSSGAANDEARARNAGIRQQQRCASEPALTAIGVCETSPLSQKTPRTLRGSVRSASIGVMTYPTIASGLMPRASQLRARSATLTNASSPQSPSSCSSQKTVDVRKSLKKVSFMEEGPGGADERGDASRKRRMGILNSLYDLRRANLDRQPADAASSSSGQEEPPSPTAEPEEPLMHATLKSTTDTSADLRRAEDVLQQAHEPIHEHGCSRHATAVISARALAVVKRKAKLLGECDARVEAFGLAMLRGEEILAAIVENTPDAASELVGLSKFMQAHTHKGDLAEANKSDFQAFVSSFCLPAEHEVLKKLEKMGGEATEWWAQAALKEARNGCDCAAVNRIIEVAAAILGNRDHEVLVACRSELGNSLAEAVLRSALTIQEKDAATVARSALPQPQSARTSSDMINTEIKTAVSMGAPSKHEALHQSKAIATTLAFEERKRWAEKALLFAREAQARDAANAEQCEGVPPVGPASAAAEAIEREVKEVMEKHGVLEVDVSIQGAIQIAKALRDEDGQRKRLAAREKRLTLAK